MNKKYKDCPECGSGTPVGSVRCECCGQIIEQVNRTAEKDGAMDSVNSYGGFWIRLGASLIDSVIVFLILILLIYFFGAYWSEDLDPIVGFILFIGYHVIFLSLYSATLGQKIYGLKVINKKTGQKIYFKRVLVRTLSYLVSSALLGLGFLLIIWDKKKQTLHDKIAKTVVIKTQDKKKVIPIIITILLVSLMAGVVYYVYSEDLYEFYPANEAEIFKALDEYILENPADFQNLLANPISQYTFEVKMSTEDSSKKPSEILQDNEDAIVLIYDYYSFGTGFLLTSNGLIATNYHVVGEAVDIAVATNDGNIYSVESVIAYDIDKDFALIKIDGDNLTHVTLGDSDKVVVGEEIVVIGNPEGLSNTISDGLISGIRDHGAMGEQLQITAPISGGSSGGPIFNMSGQVIGLVQSSITESESQNLNFGVPINYVLQSFSYSIETEETKSYRNDALGLSFSYPGNLQAVDETNENSFGIIFLDDVADEFIPAYLDGYDPDWEAPSRDYPWPYLRHGSENLGEFCQYLDQGLEWTSVSCVPFETEHISGYYYFTKPGATSVGDMYEKHFVFEHPYNSEIGIIDLHAFSEIVAFSDEEVPLTSDHIIGQYVDLIDTIIVSVETLEPSSE